ncbi:Murein L,D-transpeptidase YafK [Rhizobium sp. RU20A]|uniref:L,D-transpeptidase family protein n=1 Tax=Rhizobium sp. RU20A TaxID=1907412 RepID=UPI0009554A47|nr:murein L,D-transpeptidase family protein [Rhizobium sp. RU20A]SIQ35957.1 Murein L,D-transpeptidase YafK [Rhizobium sp. RU20A]
MRLTLLAAVSVTVLALSGCTNETLDSVDISKVSNKTAYELSPKLVSKMTAMGIQKTAPVALRIFKEEGKLEVWKANTAGRFQLVKSYDICAWSGKLGPKTKEGDRQAPEGFYPLSPAQMNPNSSYYLAINTGYPNQYDRANGRGGTHLMIHGACSSSGCYSMTDEQMIEIFAFARDAFKGGQKTIQLQAFPFRMTAENMARHRDNPHMDFWKMLKVGYDQFEVTKRPPEVAVCERKYVFNQETGGKALSPAGQCPPNMSTPPALMAAMSTYEKDYARDYDKALRKYDGLVWYEPSEAERKAIVADKRKGRELAYAPTGTSLDAGKLMKVSELQARIDAQKAAEEAREAAKVQQAALAKATATGSVPVPRENPVAEAAPTVQQTAAVEKSSRRSLFSLFSSDEPAAAPLAQPQPAQTTATVPVAQAAAAGNRIATPATPPATATQTRTAATNAAVPVPAANPTEAQAQPTTVAEQASEPKKRPFWKLWGN